MFFHLCLMDLMKSPSPYLNKAWIICKGAMNVAILRLHSCSSQKMEVLNNLIHPFSITGNLKLKNLHRKCKAILWRLGFFEKTLKKTERLWSSEKLKFLWKNLMKTQVVFTTCKGWVSMKEPGMSGFQGRVSVKEPWQWDGFQTCPMLGFFQRTSCMHLWVLGQKGAQIFKENCLQDWRWGRVWIFWKLPGQRWGWGFHKMRTVNHDI